MRRREFLLGGTAAWPLAVNAQHFAQMRRVSVLVSADETDPEGGKIGSRDT